MELRRVGEALLRSQPTTFLTRPCHQRLSALPSLTSRAYSISAVRRQQEPARSPPNNQNSQQPAQESATPSQNSPAPSQDAFSTLFDDALSFTRSDPVKRTSRFSSPRAQAENRNTTNYGFPTGSSADAAAARFQDNVNRGSSLSASFNKMRSTSFMGGGGLGALDFGRRAGPPMKSMIEAPDPATLPRLGPNIGRSVQIRPDANMDLAKGLRTMESICGRNRVRSDFYRQKYHERPGMKRKRLASERWRRRFLEGFKASVTRVQYLKRQGW